MVKLEGIQKTFGRVAAVDGVDLEIRRGEMLCLLGPSGCGKTTTLRIIAGFEHPEEGRVIMDGQDVTQLSADKRPTSMVFQSYALFPHMNVYENIAYGLRVRKTPTHEIKTLVSDMLEMVGMAGLEERTIRQLSGGQQQRVALARALVVKPAVLLLDEPLSNLDAKLRVETRLQIRDIQRELEITSIFVTHDQEEALTISDRIAVMNKGKIVQIGDPEEVYNRPNCEFVADFIGKSNFFEGEYSCSESGKASFTLDGAEISLEVPPVDLPPGKYRYAIRPEQIMVTPEPVRTPQTNCLRGVVEHITFLGEVIYYHVRLENDERILAPVYYVSTRTFKEGEQIYLSWSYDAGLILTE